MTGNPYTPPNPPTLYAANSLLGDNLSIITWVGADGQVWPISGGMAPVLAAQEGVSLVEIKGLMGTWKHLDQSSAHQDGVDWLDAVWEPQEVDITVDIGGLSANGFRRVQRNWMAGWDPKLTGKLVWFSRELGEWWLSLRMYQGVGDSFKAGPASMGVQTFSWTARADLPFWQSFDSTSTLIASGPTWLYDPLGINPGGFLRLTNRGDQAQFPQYLIQGPCTQFWIADAQTGTRIWFNAALTSSQTILINTLPRLQSVTDLTDGANLYPYLSGRFSTPIPAGESLSIGCGIAGAEPGVTQISASLTPYRKWPE